jgi:hypothetical protein
MMERDFTTETERHSLEHLKFEIVLAVSLWLSLFNHTQMQTIIKN